MTTVAVGVATIRLNGEARGDAAQRDRDQGGDGGDRGCVGPLDSGRGLGAASAGAATTSSAPGSLPIRSRSAPFRPRPGRSSSNFSSLIYGEQAYFKYINAQGGINGRKINLKYTLDDGGNPSQFNQLASTLINQDHVFAVTGVATAFFTPSLFVEAKIPTYGYNVTDNWGRSREPLRRRRLGAVLPGRSDGHGLVIRKTKSTKIAMVAYGVASSAAACQAADKGLTAAGYDVAYTDFKVAYPGTTVATDVQRMKQAGPT